MSDLREKVGEIYWECDRSDDSIDEIIDIVRADERERMKEDEEHALKYAFAMGYTEGQEKGAASEQERILQAINDFFGNNAYQNVWKDTLIEAIRKAPSE